MTNQLIQVCWIPILKANKLILAGDPLQLPPTIMSINEKAIKKGNATQENRKTIRKGPNGTPKNASKATSARPSSQTRIIVPISNDSESQLSTTVPTSSSSDTDEEPSISEVSELSKEVITKHKKPHYDGVLQPPRSLETTLFDRLERMYGPGVKRMLTVQYRYISHTAYSPSSHS